MQTVKIDRTKEWTVEDYLQLGEMNTPCQLINGELIMNPSPTPYHQAVIGNLYELIKPLAKEAGGLVFLSPLDVHIDKKNVYQPDLIYIRSSNKHIVTQRAIEGVPDLVIEVISPSNIFSDRNTKKKVYQRIGVAEYWIVDPANQTLEVYLKDQTDPDVPFLYVVTEGIVTSTVLTELQFNLNQIF
ncbi:Uma2 family endonuclease [Chryseosolibacter indicus]|uniref:Uma2 family endonuclease n=1 Tax=Chryseosolibacter indicus TaxID=2782351 RepID=A0ABS5VTB4_9BACT|nr:Uma2 family endonuclease [Chryseosolibacter indicus]MBT1704670.1 Uma2 family endonuclease [Chryseosolibacter indicus]